MKLWCSLILIFGAFQGVTAHAFLLSFEEYNGGVRKPVKHSCEITSDSVVKIGKGGRSEKSGLTFTESVRNEAVLKSLIAEANSVEMGSGYFLMTGALTHWSSKSNLTPSL